MMHPTLARQLRKLGIESDQPCLSVDQWQRLLDQVSRSYQLADEDRERLERSLDVSSREMRDRLVEMKHLALHDKLTGLANRGLFVDRVELALAKRTRVPSNLAVMFVDLDHFKIINDSLGHHAGDALIKAVSDRLRFTLRAGDTVARFGGDEFTILLEDLESLDEVGDVAGRILNEFAQPLDIVGTPIFASMSLGIMYLDGPNVPTEELIRCADAAMYQAKAGGGNCFAIYDETMGQDTAIQLELETALRYALDRNELSVAYQPIVNLCSGEIIGVEALARWTHPEKGAISPAQFIPLAEESGLVVPIGYWVLEQACLKAKEWVESGAVEGFMLSVNMSAKQLERQDVVDRVLGTLQSTGLSAKHLNLEVTESVFIWNRDDIAKKLNRLREAGISIAIDDFGTGYSSLSVLSKLPVDAVKIDRSFVKGLGETTESGAIVGAIMAIAGSMNLKVVGEGIETEFQRSRILDMGCAAGQGFLFAKPMSADEILTILDEQQEAA